MSVVCSIDGTVKMVLTCKVCLILCEHTIGFSHNQCSSCGGSWSTDSSIPELVKKMRDYMKLTRSGLRHMLRQAGKEYKLNTIRNYECQQCSHPYFKAVTALVREFNKNKNFNVF